MIPAGPFTHRRLRRLLGGEPVACRYLVRFLGVAFHPGRVGPDGKRELVEEWHYRCDRCGTVWMSTPLGGEPMKVRTVEFTQRMNDEGGWGL